MKTIIVLAVLVAAAVAAPPSATSPSTSHPVVLVKEVLHDNIGTGEGYQFLYEQNDGQKRHETAEPINVLAEDGSVNHAYKVKGYYSYIHPETHEEYKVTYVADENGFVPVVPKIH